MFCPTEITNDNFARPIGAEVCFNTRDKKWKAVVKKHITFFMPKCPKGYEALGMWYVNGNYESW